VGKRYQDRESAEKLILDHLPDIVTLCNRTFSQKSDAQDATQEAAIAVLRALPSYRGDGPVRHWLLKVAMNAARTHRRKLARKTRRETVLRDDVLPHSTPASPEEEREQQEALRSAISELPDDVRESLILRYYNGMTQAEIGKCLGCSQKTVHKRLSKGTALLNRRLSGSMALGALLAAPSLAGAALDAVAPELLIAVKNSIGGYYAATAAAATTGASGSVAVGQTVASTSAAAGGILMQTKLLVGAAAIAVTFFFGGAVMSDHVFSTNVAEEHATVVAGLQTALDAERANTAAALLEQTNKRARTSSREATLARELELARGRLQEKDQAIAELDESARGLAAADTGRSSKLSRDEQWKAILESVGPTMAIMKRMSEKGANQFELGPQMVAELGKLSAEQFEEIAAFDAAETDPEITDVIRAVMLQAFIFIPSTESLKNDYMDRYLERARNSAYGDGFNDSALSRISFSMPPFVDAYKKIVDPLDDDLKRKFLDTALGRIAAGNSDSMRLDGARFLARNDDPKATEELTRVFGQGANSARLRLVALKGLSTRADEDVLRFLKDAQNTESDARVATELEKAVSSVERLVARKQ